MSYSYTSKIYSDFMQLRYYVDFIFLIPNLQGIFAPSVISSREDHPWQTHLHCGHLKLTIHTFKLEFANSCQEWLCKVDTVMIAGSSGGAFDRNIEDETG